MEPPRQPAAGWHRDPFGRFELRYFNGATWTADVSNGGERLVDALGVTALTQPWSMGGRRRDRRATAALVLGIVGLTTAWIPFIFVAGVVCAVLGIVFGAGVLRRRSDPRGFALTGVITGTAALLLAALGVVTTRVVTDAVSDFVDEPPAVVELARCAVDAGVIVVSGSIENRGDRASDYRIVVAVTGDLLPSDQRIKIDVDDVQPGVPVPFRVERGIDVFGVEPEVSCEVADVTGPPPFGIELD